MQITYFVHAATTDNENGIATGWDDGELSELGIKQSQELADVLKDQKFDLVVCSDLKRAVQTAEIAFGDKFLTLQDKSLRGVNYGQFNGKPKENVEPLERWIDKPFPGGESYRDVEKRIRELLNELAQKYQDKKIAFVAHQAPQLALEVIVNHKTWDQAIATDWRKTASWQAGWEYKIRT